MHSKDGVSRFRILRQRDQCALQGRKMAPETKICTFEDHSWATESILPEDWNPKWKSRLNSVSTELLEQK